jgi:hypothetical protein
MREARRVLRTYDTFIAGSRKLQTWYSNCGNAWLREAIEGNTLARNTQILTDKAHKALHNLNYNRVCGFMLQLPVFRQHSTLRIPREILRDSNGAFI